MYPMRFSNSTQHNAHLLGDPVLAMPDLPEHTKRLLFAQAMLNNQRALNDECERLIAARRVDLLRKNVEARAREEDLARRAAEVDESLGDAERAMNARRGFRNVARHLSSMRNLGLAPKKETESFPKPPGIPEKPTFAQARREAMANALATARRDPNGYVDLRPEPPLPPVPALLSLDKNPVVPDEKHVYALKKRKPGKAAGVREAVLAAAAVAGDDAVAAWPSARTARDDIEAFARAYDDDEFPDAPPETVPAKVPGDERGTPSARRETYVRYHHRKPHSRWEGVRDDSDEKNDEDDPRDVRKRERDRLEAAVETHAARLERDAAAASSAGKFTKAEHYLRQLVALRVAGGDGGPRQSRQSRFRAFVGTVGAVAGDAGDTRETTRLPVTSPAETDLSVRSETRAFVDPVAAARALALLARAVRAQRNPRRVAETAALFGRAAAAIAAENGDDDAGVAADSDAEASTRLAALDGLSAASAALDSKQGDRDALRYARRALAYAEKRFGPWDPRARAARESRRRAGSASATAATATARGSSRVRAPAVAARRKAPVSRPRPRSTSCVMPLRSPRRRSGKTTRSPSRRCASSRRRTSAPGTSPRGGSTRSGARGGARETPSRRHARAVTSERSRRLYRVCSVRDSNA